jgi:hypothetical protein
MNFKHAISRLCLLVLTLLGIGCTQGNNMKDIDYSTYYSDPAEIELIKAVMNGDASTVRRLAASGVNLNAVGKYEITPLRTALKCQQKEIVALLLQLGVDPNFTTPGKAVPAFVALKLDDPDYLNMLLAHGLDPNLQEDGAPLVFMAIREGQWSHFKTLINKGADIQSRSRNNSTLALELVGVSQYDLAKALILHGADFTTPNNTGLTVLEVLVNDQTRLCADPRHPACLKRAELLRMLKEKGVDVPPGLPGMS